jgi:hypothetical protein
MLDPWQGTDCSLHNLRHARRLHNEDQAVCSVHFVKLLTHLTPIARKRLVVGRSCFRFSNWCFLMSVLFLFSLETTQYDELLTQSMEQSPSWEADLFSATQEIPSILWHPNVHYRTHKCPSPIPILIIIIIFIYCKLVVTRWQWLLYTYFLTLLINLLREGYMISM